MRIIGFAEGALEARGGLGLVGLPMILGSLAARGHEVALVLAGPINPGREKYLSPDISTAFRRPEGNGAFGIAQFKASSRWALSLQALWRPYGQVRSVDFVTLHSLYQFPVLAGYLLARVHRKPYGLWPHGVLAPFQRRVSARRKWFYDKLVARRILDGASVLIFSAKGERDEVAELGLKAPAVVIPDGFDARPFSALPAPGTFRARYFGGHSGPLVLFVARLNAKKGVDVLIKAMARVAAVRPEARLAIVGPPDPLGFEQRVLEWIRDAGIESRTVMTGFVDFPTKLAALADADIFVLPSEAENFGHSMFEAMTCRVPVVVSDTLNYANDIGSGGAGLVVPRSADRFATAILCLLDDKELRQQMGLRGHELSRAYSSERTGDALERTIQSVLQGLPLPADLVA